MRTSIYFFWEKSIYYRVPLILTIIERRSVLNPGYPVSYYRIQSIFLQQDRTFFTSQSYTHEASVGTPGLRTTSFPVLELFPAIINCLN